MRSFSLCCSMAALQLGAVNTVRCMISQTCDVDRRLTPSGCIGAVASWYVVGSQSYYSSLKQVAAGKSLTGVITLTGHTSGNPWKYTSVFSNVSGTSLKVSSPTELTWATETLEAYSISKKADYPAGSTVFSDINIRTKAGTPSVTWTAHSDAADGITTTVNANGATDAKITIKY